MTSLEWKFWGVGGGGLIGRTIRGGGGWYGYFLESHIWDHYPAFLSCNCWSSVSKIIICHLDTLEWLVINFACKRGVGRQHTTFTSCQNAAFSNDFCLWRVDYVLEGFVLTKKMWFFCAYFILRGCDMHIDFLRLLFLVGVICPLMQELIHLYCG